MEVDGVAEVFAVSIAAGHALDPLDPAIEGFRSRVRHVRGGGIDDVFLVLLDHASHTLDGLDARPDGPAVPAPSQTLSPASAEVNQSSIAASLIAQARATFSRRLRSGANSRRRSGRMRSGFCNHSYLVRLRRSLPARASSRRTLHFWSNAPSLHG